MKFKKSIFFLTIVAGTMFGVQAQEELQGQKALMAMPAITSQANLIQADASVPTDIDDLAVASPLTSIRVWYF